MNKDTRILLFAVEQETMKINGREPIKVNMKPNLFRRPNESWRSHKESHASKLYFFINIFSVRSQITIASANIWRNSQPPSGKSEIPIK